MKARAHYAGRVATRRAIQMARDADIDLGGLDFLPDGTIRLIEKDTFIALTLRQAEDRANAAAASPPDLRAVA